MLDRPRRLRSVRSSGRNQECATASASAFFHDQKPIIAIFRWTVLAEPVAHEELAVKTHCYNVVIQRRSLDGPYFVFRFISVSLWLRESGRETGPQRASATREPLNSVETLELYSARRLAFGVFGILERFFVAASRVGIV